MFPLELFEATVECLAAQGTLDDLHQCALVNKQLAQLCQKHIFRTIALVQRETRWNIPAEQRVPLPPHPIERFADLIQQSPVIATYVRKLEIVNMQKYNVDDGYTALAHLTFTFAIADVNRKAEDQKPWETISPGLRSSLLSFVGRNPIVRLSLFNLGGLPSSFLKRCRHLQTLSVHNVDPDSSISPAIMGPFIKLKRLELLEDSMVFAEHFILHPTAHILDISEISVLKVDFGIHDNDHVVSRVLGLPVQLEALDLYLIKNFSEWTCRNNIIGRLPPPSLSTLRRVHLVIDTLETPELQPYGEFPHELAEMQGQNILEELQILIKVQFDSDLDLDPIRWKELDDVLASGFSYLRKLTVRVQVAIFEGPAPFEEAARKQAILEKILDEGFSLIKHRHDVELTTSAECMVI
ncbi:hypothetical protein CC2G_012243 [Coprinopsis cinerea AmutBmut pab1-1]|nr:hypothetical protein CC2G_012243 [Coprinopsis cinerea AmutBmut pab1-1]